MRARRLLSGFVGAVLGVTIGSVLWAAHSGAAPVEDTAYTAVPPCVVFDSRPSQGAAGTYAGPVNGNQSLDYKVTGTYPTSPSPDRYGGGSTTCGIPAGAVAVEINIVAVNALNEGNLRVTDGSAAATGGVVNYNALAPKLNTSNSVIVPLSATGQLRVTPNCGPSCAADSTDIRGVVLGYFTNGLAQRVAALEALLKDVTRTANGIGGQDTLQLSGMNLQIVDGSGTTDCNDGLEPLDIAEPACNGQGNLVIGYAENPAHDTRTGSHNLVAGRNNGWSSFGGAVFGFGNQITNDLATVTGGAFNIASGGITSVTGGEGNTAEGAYATVSGGSGNHATGFHSSVSGGTVNRAEDTASSVSGGAGNKALGEYSSVTGGSENTAFSKLSVVVGGISNQTSGDERAALVVGGEDNEAIGEAGVVVGGHFNSALGYASVSSGGESRSATGALDWWGGGFFQDS